MKTVKLFINRDPDFRDYYRVNVFGEGFYDSEGKTVGARVRGDDEWFDDRLFSLPSTHVIHGGVFALGNYVHKSQLNEDWGEDEIYAVVDVGGDTFTTNTVRGNF
ncbi:MAG TPA: hypothetical protein VGW58_02550 [Pyrinomonadaceae bacterium]|nr:hypothetical protein [Pyrinomonadaceae bacterium]